MLAPIGSQMRFYDSQRIGTSRHMANQRWENAGCLRVVAGSIKLERSIEPP